MSVSAAPPIDSKPRRGPRIWLRLLILLALILAAPLLFYALDRLRVEWALRAAWAEADRTDPGWRYEDLQSKRELIPDEENGALQVLKALKHLPKKRYMAQWKRIAPGADWSSDEQYQWRYNFENALDDQPANTMLNAQQILGLEGEIEECKPALQQLQGLFSFSKGRFAATGSKANPLPPEISASRDLMQLLGWQVRINAHRQNWSEATQDCRAAFALARCIGDEPSSAAALVRSTFALIATVYVERLLGQGPPPAELLIALQQDIRSESELSHFLRSARADRAETYVMFRQIAASELSPVEMKAVRMLITPRKADAWLNGPEEKNWFAQLRERFGLDVDWKRWETEAMQASNGWVVIAKLSPLEQYAAYKAKRAQYEKDRKPLLGVTYNLAAASFRSQAKLRATEAALALERCRQESGRWPDRLDDLVPRYVQTVPIDLFTGEPLRYRRLADGVTIYSVGLDEQDNGGKTRYLPNEFLGGELQTGLDIGVRLWDPDKRRAPPLPPLPPPKRELPDDF